MSTKYMQLRECAVHVIRNYATAAGHLVVLSAACICCLFSIARIAYHEMALEPIARALQIILQPPTAPRQLANFVFLLPKTIF
jgi:hypothetical protein